VYEQLPPLIVVEPNGEPLPLIIDEPTGVDTLRECVYAQPPLIIDEPSGDPLPLIVDEPSGGCWNDGELGLKHHRLV